MKDKLKRILSCFLVFALLIQMAPFETLAADVNAAETESTEVTTSQEASTVSDETAAEVYIEGEVMEARDEYEKHYRLTNGSFVAAQFQVPVHYEDNGEWVDIDNTLQAVAMYDGTEVYQAVNGDHTQAFSSTLADGSILSIGQGNASITMSLWDGTATEEMIADETAEETVEAEVPVETTEETPAETTTEAEPDAEDTTAEEAAVDGSTGEIEVIAEESAETSTEVEDAQPDEAAATEETAETETIVEESPVEEISAEEITEDTIDETAELVLPAYNRDAVAQIMGGNDAVALAETDEETQLRDVTDVIPDTLSNTVLYEDVYPNVDLQYDLFGYDVKESIILNAPASEAVEINVSEDATTAIIPYTYTFLMNLDGLTPELQEDGSVLLLNADNEAEFTIPAPYMMDANGEFSEAVFYTLEEIAEGWLLTVQADAEWLEDGERAYPVTIDPTIVSKKNESNFSGGTAAQYVPSSEVSTTQMASGYHDEYGQLEAYFTINSMPELDPGCTVVDCTVGLQLIDYIPQYNSSAKCTLFIHQVTEAPTSDTWLSELTWANKPDYGEAMDFVNTNGGEIGNYLYWNVTRAAKEWYEGSAENYGLAITSDRTSETAYRAWFRYATTAVLLLTYRNTTGTESYYTYETQSAVRAGTGYVGDYSSELTVIKDDLSYSSTAMPFSLAHVYNSGLRTGDIYDAVQAGITAPDYSKMRMGYGWQLSVQESIKKVTIDDTLYLVYRDSDGTQHFFSGGIDYNGSVFSDEDGLNLTITLGTANGRRTYTLKDSEGNKKFFYNAYLVYSADGNGNRIYYVYNDASFDEDTTTWYPPASEAYLSSIVSMNNGQEEPETICTFTYTNDYLASITDYAGRVTSFTYENDRLTQITHPDGTSAYYRYDDETGHLEKVYDAEAKYGIEYVYEQEGNGVVEIKEYVATTVSGTPTYGTQIKRYKNGVQEAVYRFDGDDRTLNTSDDIVTRYAFDFAGRTINATTLNSDESEILGVTAAAYTESSGTSSTNNRIEKDAQSGQAGVNLLTAGGAESHDSFSAPSDFWNRISTDSRCNGVVKTGELVRTGTNAFKIWLATNAPEDSNGDQRHGLYQTVTLERNKTYTFSAYVNTEQITQFGEAGGLYVAFADNAGNIVAAGDKVTEVTNQNIEDGWQRVHVTYTPTSSGKYRVVLVQENAYPYGFFDDLQLEVGSAPSNVNLLQNGSFTSDTEWASGDYTVTTDDSLHTSVNKATASSTGMKRESQTVPINGSAKDTYLLSGWAKASSAADTEEKLTDSTAESNTTKRYFGLIARIDYTDDTKEYFYMPFNDDYTGWQYASCVIAPKKANQEKTIESITVITAYDLNINTVCFDDISLRKEPCTTYTYDSKGNVTAVNATGNSAASFSYASGTTKLTKSVTEENGTYEYEYKDSNNDNLVTKIKNDGVSMGITYDAIGNSTATTLSSDSDSSVGSIKTSATYSDDGSQLLTQTNASGYTTTYTYDSFRRKTGSKDNAGTLTQNRYTDSNDRVSMTYQSGVVSTHFYYTAGMLTSLVRGGYIAGNSTKQNQTYTMDYDGFGNMTSIAVGSRTLATYAHGTGNGNLKSMTYGNGDQVSYTYDNLDRIVSETYYDENGEETKTYNYYYNAEGDLAKKVDTDSDKAVNYEYDSLGRLIHSYQTSGDSIVQRTEHLYDTSNRLISQSWTLGSNTYSESYTYDEDDGSLATMTPAAGDTITYTYDALKRLYTKANDLYTQKYTYRDITAGTQTTTQVSKLTYSEVNSDDSFSNFNIQYTYDDLGNIETVTSAIRTVLNATYDYDQQGQLISESNYVGDYTYTYDTYGNIRSVSGDETHTYTYGNADWLDLLTAYDGETITYDAIGNPTSYYNGTRWTFGWSNGRQLTTASKSGTSISYTYDVAGIRDSKTVNGVTYNYLTQNGQVVRQTWTDASGSHVMDFIYDNNGRPYAFLYDSTLYFYILNQQGDVIVITDVNGATVGRYAYDAWGEVIFSSGSMVSVNPLRYRGYYYDTETGLYYVSSRYYDPVVKRFINADACVSTGQAFLGYNMFAYCLNNPVNYVDANGNYAVSAILAATNFWNPLGWVAAAAFVVESTIVTACVIALTYEAYQNIADEPRASTASASNSSQKQQSPAQVNTKSVSTPASPTPPNDDDNNKPSLQRLSKQLLKQCGLDAHKVKQEFLGKKAKISLYDLAYDKKTGIIYIINKAGQIVEQTYYNIWASTY